MSYQCQLGTPTVAATKRPRRWTRRLLTYLTTLAMIGVLAGCGSPDLKYEPAIGSNARTPTIQALSLAVVTNDKGVGTLVGSVLNEAKETDHLIDVKAASDNGPITTRLPAGPVALPHDELVKLATQNAVMLRSDNVRQGFWIDLTLRFDNSAPMELKAPVEPQSGPYAEIEVTTPPDGDISP